MYVSLIAYKIIMCPDFLCNKYTCGDGEHISKLLHMLPESFFSSHGNDLCEIVDAELTQRKAGRCCSFCLFK